MAVTLICATLPAESPAVASFVNKFMLGQSSVNSDVEVNPYPTLDYRRWTWWWGNNPDTDPQFPDPWVSDGSFVLPLDARLGFVSFDEGQTIEAGYQLKIPGTHAAATATLTSGDVSADIRCSDGCSYTLTIPLPTNQAYSIPANKDGGIQVRPPFRAR
jgi:hypothetical protein